MVAVEHGGEKLPVLVFLDLALGFETPHLFIERVEKLLSGGGAGVGTSGDSTFGPGPGSGVGGGIEIASAATVSLDSFTVNNTTNNNVFAFYGSAFSNIDGTYILLP